MTSPSPAQPQLPAVPVAQAPTAVREGFAPAVGQPRGGRGLFVLGTVALLALSLVAMAVVAYLVGGLGPAGFTFGAVLALVPLAIVLFGVRWVDRWEPEPRGVLAFAFLWGAAVAVVIALTVGAELSNLASAAGISADAYALFGSVIQAPIVEETGKGLAVLLIFWFARKHFDGPVDGIVYAAVTAAGFAFTENIIYFAQSLSEGAPAEVVQTFFIRGLLSPFAHVMFTACTGLLLGIAARRTGALGGIGFFLIGLIPAIFLHALWNGSLYLVQDFYGYYALVQFPLFLVFVALVVFLRRQETRVTRLRLADYAAAGWFSPGEVDVLGTGPGRRSALAWASRNGVRSAMVRYIRDSTRLALARQRVLAGRPESSADEAALLASIVANRRALAGSTAR